MNFWFRLLGGLCLSALSAAGQFVAFNDYDSGEQQAHPFVTRYSLSYGSQTNDVQGLLRDVDDGLFLSVQVRISGGLGFPRSTTNFFPGTPATIIFGGANSVLEIVNFRDSGLTLNGTNTHTFSGLNPSRKYQFIGTANFSAPSNSTHRTLYAIEGADSYESSHTSNCLTSAQLSLIASNQVALLAGRNSYPGYGDLVVWNNIRPGDDGMFSVTATPFMYEIGMSLGGFRLVEDFVEPTPPFITKQPVSVSASRASVQSLSPRIAGSLPLSFQWFKDGNPVPSGTNRTLRFNSLLPEHAGNYWLVATNPYGTVTTTNVMVSVANDAIGIVTQPQHRALRYGDPLLLSVTVTGTPPLFFQWLKQGVAIVDATNRAFQIAAANVYHAGSYSVRVSNLFSAALSSNATVTVAQNPLRITEQPQSLVVTQGTTLRLQVAVDGSAPRFQWFRNGTAIVNAVSSVYRAANATTNLAATYFVVATGPLNTVTSDVAQVTVVPPPPPEPRSWFPLLALTNEWAYNQSPQDLDSGWREVGYDDSGWARGRGVLAREDSLPTRLWTNTVLQLTTESGQPIITTYFRTHFTWPTNSLGAVLVFSNLIDDGAVFYLNGVPLFRTNMPNGIVTSATLALASAIPEGAFTIVDVGAPMMVEGDNVLAVEVHQNSPTSSDIVFGTAVFGDTVADGPLAVVSQPASLTVLEGEPFDLNFELNAPANFVWYRNGFRVSATPGPRLMVASAVPADAGAYYAVATNSLGVVTSAVAVVEVVADLQVPRVRRAVLQTNRTSILVEFDEKLLPATATNTDHYRVLTSDGVDAAAVMSAAYSNRVVTLTLAAPPLENTNLLLRVDGIADVASASNRVDGLVAIHQHLLLVPLEGVWKYDDRGLDLGVAWRAANYDDSLWPSGPAMFYNDNNYGGDIPFPSVPPVLATNTWIQLTNDGVPVVTHYFRRFIDHGAASLIGAQLSLYTMIDDGAVMYLNGSEFFRLGVTNDPLYATNLASRPRGTSMETFMEGPFFADFPAIISGADSNVLAVETHQINPVDVSFGAEISLLFKSFTNEPVQFVRQPSDLFVAEGQPFAFEVDSLGGTHAQWLRNGIPIDGAHSEILSLPRASLSDDGSVFALSLSNAFSAALSSNATLHVLPDANAPHLLSAFSGQSLTEITLTFSEAINAASVTNLGQYQVRDDQGRSVTITSAVLVDPTTLILTTASRVRGRNYEVRVEGVRDLAAVPNELEPGTGAIIGYEQVLVPLTAVWRYDQSGNGQVEAWKGVAFDDSSWLAGSALLYNDDFGAAPPAVPLATILSITNAAGAPIVVHYFRHAFELPELAAGASLWMRHAFDDALVLYLNGHEIFRTNVPAGVVDATTLASGGSGAAVVSVPAPVPYSASAGLAVLAGETHQTSTALGSDVAFAVELAIRRPSTTLPSVGPTLRLSQVGAELWLSWTALGYRLESAQSLQGPWLNVEGAVSPRLVNVSDPMRFYRLRKL